MFDSVIIVLMCGLAVGTDSH